MQISTSGKRRLAVTALVAGALTIAAPVASADVVDRAVAAKLSQQPTFQGSPDAIDRAVPAPSFQGSPDAIDRAVPAPSFQGSPDAIERAVVARQLGTRFQGSPDAMDRQIQAPSYAPDAFERALITNANSRTEAAAVVTSSEIVTSSGLDWSDFGIGAGVGLGSALLLIGLGLGVTLRRGQRVTTA